MLQFDNSCYVGAKQYHLALFSTRNSTLNTSLRKPIRMQDFIQLCDSFMNTDLWLATLLTMYSVMDNPDSVQFLTKL